MSNDRSFLKSQWASFSTVGRQYEGQKKIGVGAEGQRQTFSDTPDVFTSFNDAAIRGLHVFSGTNDRERNSINQDAGMVCILVVRLQRGCVDPDSLRGDDFANL